MANYTSFTQAFKQISKKIDSSKQAAIKKALTSARAELAKQVSAELGIPSGTVKARTKSLSSPLAGILSVGTKFEMRADQFNKLAKIKIQSRRGLRYGARYGNNNSIAPSGILVTAASGKRLILTRLPNRKMAVVRVPGFLQAVTKFRSTIQRVMVDSFKKNFSSSLKYYLNK